MATISSTPDALNPVEKAVKWVGLQTPTADPIETRFGYKLQVDGSDIFDTERSALPLTGSDPIILDMKDDLLGHVVTKIPSPTLVGTENDSVGMIREATLVFGTIEIDKSTDPPTVTKNVSTNSGPFKFINSAVNVFDATDMTAITKRVLSWIPDEISMFHHTRAWIWFLGGTGINFTWKYGDGTTGSDTGTTAPFDVGIIPPSPVNIGIPTPEDLVYIDIELIDIGRTIRVNIECVEPIVDTAAIMFLEPPGGRSTIAFHDVSGLSMSASYQLVKKYRDPGLAFGTFQNTAGYSISAKEGGASRTFSKVMKNSNQAMQWMDGFMGSSEYHLQHKDTADNYIWNKFIVTGSSYNIDQASGLGNLVCSGYLANQIISQRGHV